MNAAGAGVGWTLPPSPFPIPPFSRYFTPRRSPDPSEPPRDIASLLDPALPQPALPERRGGPGGALRLRSRRGGDRRERGLTGQRGFVSALDVLARCLDAVVAEQAGDHFVHGNKGGGRKA